MAKLAITVGFAILGAVSGGLGWLGFLGGSFAAGGASAAMLGFSIGATIGGIIGGIAFPGKLPTSEGPRLDNLRVQTSTYGVQITIGYGTIRTAGNVIDSSGLVEHKTTTNQSAKGAPSQSTITYTYTNTFAVAFTEGIGDIQQMWADGKIIFDASGASAITAFDTKDPKGHVVKAGLTCRVYRGDEIQLPDGSLESLHGVGNVPAYRGLIYVVFEDMLLTNFGNRIPNITANISYQQDVTFDVQTAIIPVGEGTADLIYGNAGNRGEFILGSRNASVDRIIRVNPSNGSVISFCTAPVLAASPTMPMSTCCDMDGYVYGNDALNLSKFDRLTGAWIKSNFWPNGGFVCYVSYHKFSDQREYIFAIEQNAGRIAGTIIDNRNPGGANDFVFDGEGYVLPLGATVISQVTGLGIAFDNDENVWALASANALVGTNDDGYLAQVVLKNGHSSLTGFFTTVNRVTLSGAVYGRPCSMWHCPDDDTLIFITATSQLVKWDIATAAVIATADISAYVTSVTGGYPTQMSRFGLDRNGQLAMPGADGYTLHLFDAVSLEHTHAYDVRALTGNVAFTFHSTVAYDPLTATFILGNTAPDSYYLIRVTAAGGGADLAAIVTDVCERCSLSPSQFDVTQLVGKNVPGYLINNGSSGRAAIESLASLYLFGGVESDFKIKFVQGGNSGVFTIPEDDLMEIENGIRLVELRMQELDLPLEVAVTYLDLNFDYQPGTQREQRFNTTFSVDKSTLSVPIALDAATAKQLAAKVLYLMWAQRNKYQFQAMPKWMLQDALDVGTFGYKGETFHIKLTNATLGLAYQMAFECVVDDANAYASVLPTDGGQATTHGAGVHIISSIPYTEFQVIDTPLLRDEDAGDTVSGFYFTTTPRGQGTWPGAVAEQSVDDIAFNSLISAVVEPTWGYVNSVVAAPPSPWSPDTVNTITVLVSEWDVRRGVAGQPTRGFEHGHSW